jgi:glycosyltransferase involved in cell wall biosynthesis
MNITVIVPTYNRPRALKLSLLSLAQQSVLPNEVLIADDGSTSETAELVASLRETLKEVFPIRHVWHEDRGFRKPMILNEAVRQSTGEYLIFLDGDCMAHRHFIRAHIESGAPDAIISGKRVEVGRELTERLLEREQVVNRLTPRLLWDALRGRSRKVEEAIMLRNPLIRKLAHRDRITDDGIWGCNFSISKQLFLEINGCDEDFLDGSIEDNDLGIRVLNQGKQVRSVRGLAIIFHLWHKSTWDFSNEKYLHNKAVLKRRIENREAFCRNGIYKR